MLNYKQENQLLISAFVQTNKKVWSKNTVAIYCDRIFTKKLFYL